MSDQQATTETSRRKFLRGAAVAATGAAALGFPRVAKAQGPITMRWQSTWPSKDIFHEYALDFAKKVNDMTGGDLKIEVLPAGAVVPAFGLPRATRPARPWRRRGWSGRYGSRSGAARTACRSPCRRADPPEGGLARAVRPG